MKQKIYILGLMLLGTVLFCGDAQADPLETASTEEEQTQAASFYFYLMPGMPAEDITITYLDEAGGTGQIALPASQWKDSLAMQAELPYGTYIIQDIAVVSDLSITTECVVTEGGTSKMFTLSADETASVELYIGCDEANPDWITAPLYESDEGITLGQVRVSIENGDRFTGNLTIAAQNEEGVAYGMTLEEAEEGIMEFPVGMYTVFYAGDENAPTEWVFETGQQFTVTEEGICDLSVSLLTPYGTEFIILELHLYGKDGSEIRQEGTCVLDDGGKGGEAKIGEKNYYNDYYSHFELEEAYLLDEDGYGRPEYLDLHRFRVDFPRPDNLTLYDAFGDYVCIGIYELEDGTYAYRATGYMETFTDGISTQTPFEVALNTASLHDGALPTLPAETEQGTEAEAETPEGTETVSQQEEEKGDGENTFIIVVLVMLLCVCLGLAGALVKKRR